MRSVARAEPATEIAGLADRHASQVGAHPHHDQPFGLLHAVFVFLRVAEDGDAGVDMLVLLEEGWNMIFWDCWFSGRNVLTQRFRHP